MKKGGIDSEKNERWVGGIWDKRKWCRIRDAREKENKKKGKGKWWTEVAGEGEGNKGRKELLKGEDEEGWEEGEGRNQKDKKDVNTSRKSRESGHVVSQMDIWR